MKLLAFSSSHYFQDPAALTGMQAAVCTQRRTEKFLLSLKQSRPYRSHSDCVISFVLQLDIFILIAARSVTFAQSFVFIVPHKSSQLSTPAFCTSTPVTHHPCQINWNKASFHSLVFKPPNISTLTRPTGMVFRLLGNEEVRTLIPDTSISWCRDQQPHAGGQLGVPESEW